MVINTSELREKDVVNTCDGRKLGTICDYQIDTECGKVCAIYVTEQLFCIPRDKNVIRIPWDGIVCIGADTVLVQVREDNCRGTCEPCGGKNDKRKRGGWLF